MNDKDYQARARALKKIANVYEDTPLALHLTDDSWCDIDCYGLFVHDDAYIYRIVNETPLEDMQNTLVDKLPDVTEVITDRTASEHEAYPGQIVPLEGIYCAHCGGQLHEPYEPEENS